MTHDKEALVATLQLLFGDADGDELFNILTIAFGMKITLVPPNVVRAIQYDLAQAAINTKRARDSVSEPPLGRLDCIRVKQELDAALNNLRKVESFLGNPKR